MASLDLYLSLNASVFTAGRESKLLCLTLVGNTQNNKDYAATYEVSILQH